ncbi:MAG: hypothetical protein EA392_11370 [Cryomorphaceae bacterium]|nr:MAG: hypothetical protein EA392_11370 [Cryomorphaceae bacterium]
MNRVLVMLGLAVMLASCGESTTQEESSQEATEAREEKRELNERATTQLEAAKKNVRRTMEKYETREQAEEAIERFSTQMEEYKEKLADSDDKLREGLEKRIDLLKDQIQAIKEEHGIED